MLVSPSAKCFGCSSLSDFKEMWVSLTKEQQHTRQVSGRPQFILLWERPGQESLVSLVT